jgi:hypothetical protein
MTDPRGSAEDEEARMDHDELHERTEELVTELIRTALTMEEVFTSLLPDIPDDAFPGKDKAQALFDMMVGSVEPATDAAGDDDCGVAVALIVAVRERILADLHTAAELRKEREAGS